MRRTAFLCFLLCAAVAPVMAIPGVDSYIPDSSGEYVYYADSSFTRTSVVGFMYYDDSTYALRYYAPLDVATRKLEKDITLYISVDPAAEHLTFTGERIVGETAPEDSDIINYMHDLLYEFTARRQKVTLRGITKLDNREDFAQFGGTVTVTYSNTIPLFNIESIRALDGTVLFQAQTSGQLSSSGDNSFAAFKGVSGLPKDKARTLGTSGSSGPVRITFEGQSVTVDGEWQQAMDNMWFRGNDAMLSLNAVEAPQVSAAAYETFLCRKLCQGTGGSYSVLPQSRTEIRGSSVRMSTVYYEPATGNVTRDFTILTRRKDGSYAYLSLTVFDALYQANRAYFTALLDSYVAE